MLSSWVFHNWTSACSRPIQQENNMNADYLMNRLRSSFRHTALALLRVLCLLVGLGRVLLVPVHVLSINSFETHLNRPADAYRVVVNLNSRSTGHPYELSF